MGKPSPINARFLINRNEPRYAATIVTNKAATNAFWKSGTVKKEGKSPLGHMEQCVPLSAILETLVQNRLPYSSSSSIICAHGYCRHGRVYPLNPARRKSQGHPQKAHRISRPPQGRLFDELPVLLWSNRGNHQHCHIFFVTQVI